ncbi:fumarate hydratase [Calderihabitans maritimus]|uniref:Fe-S type, tartrate/fumarate subfamily hydro-lyase subunit alpha n=1 Tax=Calderihabitans maritimus TaxID=1246530 RepID=A0A1Z5HXJ2_9FIRM|nr:fumarate hydratase [Calderihabitans maritimus]GAW94253.1 Fe-S type, tartrate/fumarate subfamily hydro-lyase subunit alpha [Calderihabitans maritimus]
MKKVSYEQVVEAVARLCKESNYFLGEDVKAAFVEALEKEESPTGKDILRQLIKNAEIAAAEEVPMCQDTGVAVVFLEVGQDVQVEGGYLYDAIQEGVRKGYTEGYLRKSMVEDPFNRKNTGDNTPAIIHTRIVPGDKLKITVAPKGGGSENMSAIAMLPPAAGLEGAKKFIVDTVRKAGPNPCPPIVVGVGIGGNFEKAALMAKEALLRPLGQPNPSPEVAALEKDLLEEINKLGIGPQGLGGRTTALAVHVEIHPCHIASLPVAVNINCHASRHKSISL